MSKHETTNNPESACGKGQLDCLVSLCDCSVRLKNVCRCNGIDTLSDMSKYMESEFVVLKACGRKTTNEARHLLVSAGYMFMSLDRLPRELTVCEPEYTYVITHRDKAILSMVATGETCKRVGEMYGISTSRVTEICKKKARSVLYSISKGEIRYVGGITGVRWYADVLLEELYGVIRG